MPTTRTDVEIPVTIFSKDAELPNGGTGRRFYTDDRRANLTVQSVGNPENDSPATFLAKKNPPPGIMYKGVTPNFFVVSSIRNDRIWYNRCNRSGGYMNCVLLSRRGKASVGRRGDPNKPLAGTKSWSSGKNWQSGSVSRNR